jgi:hypothetical protein
MTINKHRAPWKPVRFITVNLTPERHYNPPRWGEYPPVRGDSDAPFSTP